MEERRSLSRSPLPSAALCVRFPGRRPLRVLFTDRGNGFYKSGTGLITPEYDAALRQHGLWAMFDRDASIQPGSLQEVMLHETAVAWMRDRLTKTRPQRSWQETVGEYCARLKACATFINENYDVAGLCRALPQRLAELDRRQGDRLSK